MSVSQKSSNQNVACTHKLPIPIGELLESYRQQALQEATNSAPEGGSTRRREKSSEGVLYFCSLENFESAIVYLSQELQALGLGNLSLTTAGNHSTRTHDALATAFTGGVHRGTLLQLDLVCLVNRCWEVVQLYRASVRDGCTLQEQHRRDANANTKLQASVSGLQEVRQEYDRRLQEAAELRRQAGEEARQLREALLQQKEELRHLNALLLQRDTQYKHDLRRRELEGGKLRARLGHLVAEGGGPVERRLEMSSCLVPSLPLQEDRARAKWSSFADSSKHTVEVYRRVLGQYECWLAGVSSERDVLARCVETTAAALNTLVKKHAKVLAAEDMAASLTDSVYSTDSLDEPLTPAEGGAGLAAAGLQQQIREGLLALSVVLAEKGAGDPREARLKRIHELAATATPQATKSSSCRLSTGQLGRRGVVPQGKHEDVNSEGKVDGCPSPGEGSPLVRRDTAAEVHHGGVVSSDSAILQLVRHLGIVTATEGNGSVPRRTAARGDSTSSLPGCLLPGSECTPTRPSAGSDGTPTVNTGLRDAPATSTPDLDVAQAAHATPAPVSSAPGAVEGDSCLHQLPAANGADRGSENVPNQLRSGGTNERESTNSVGDDGNGVDSGIGGDGNEAGNEGTTSPGSMKRNVLDSPASEVTDLSWLRVCGGPDDSAATEVMTLKKLLEEERLEIKREKERYAEAAIRLNRERAAFEQDKVQLLRQQFLDEVPCGDDGVPPGDLTCLTPADASFYQVSPVPAWLSRHHHRPFRPAPGSPGPGGAAQGAAGRQEPHQQLGPGGAAARAQHKTRDRQKPHHQEELGHDGASQAAQSTRGRHSAPHREELGRHKRVSAPSPPSRLTSVPNITPPPPLEWEFRARSRPLLLTRAKAGKSRNSSGGSCDSGRSRHCSVAASGRRSAPATRAPSATRSHGDGCSELSCTAHRLGAELRSGGNERFSFTLGGKKSRSPSLGLRVASSSSRLSSKSRDSSLSRHSSKGRESSATSSSNTRDSSVSRLANKNRESFMSNRGTNDGFAGGVAGCSSVRYHTLPRSYKSSLKSTNENGPLEKCNVTGLARLSETSRSVVNWTGADDDWIITRGPALVARTSMDASKCREQVRRSVATSRHDETPTGRSRGRQQPALFNSKSLPRTFHKSPTSIPALDAGCTDLRSSSEVEQVDDSTRRRPGQTDSIPMEKQNNMRPKSDSFSQAVDVNSMYASLTPELLSKIDSNDGLQNSSVLSDKVSPTCSGACKEFLKVPSTAACLCHLLRQKRISLEREASELSLPVSTDASDFDAFDSVSQAELHHDFKTNQRIDAIESSLLNLISQITSNDKNVHRSTLTSKNHDALVDATLYKRDLGQDSLHTSMSSNESEVNNASMVSAPPAAGDSMSRGDNHARASVSSRRSLVRHNQGLARAEPVENLPCESERILQARNLLSSLRLSTKSGMRPRQGSASSHANSD